MGFISCVKVLLSIKIKDSSLMSFPLTNRNLQKGDYYLDTPFIFYTKKSQSKTLFTVKNRTKLFSICGSDAEYIHKLLSSYK